MFHQFYQKILSQSESLTEPPKLSRPRKLSRQLESGSPADQHHCSRDLHRQAYYEALDLVSEEVSRRFQQEDLILIKEIESLMLNTVNGNSLVDIPDSIGYFLKDDFDLDQLKVQLNMIPDLIATAFDNSVKKVTNLRTISSAMLESRVY